MASSGRRPSGCWQPSSTSTRPTARQIFCIRFFRSCVHWCKTVTTLRGVQCVYFCEVVRIGAKTVTTLRAPIYSFNFRYPKATISAPLADSRKGHPLSRSCGCCRQRVWHDVLFSQLPQQKRQRVMWVVLVLLVVFVWQGGRPPRGLQAGPELQSLLGCPGVIQLHASLDTPTHRPLFLDFCEAGEISPSEGVVWA